MSNGLSKAGAEEGAAAQAVPRGTGAGPSLGGVRGGRALLPSDLQQLGLGNAWRGKPLG